MYLTTAVVWTVHVIATGEKNKHVNVIYQTRPLDKYIMSEVVDEKAVTPAQKEEKSDLPAPGHNEEGTETIAIESSEGTEVAPTKEGGDKVEGGGGNADESTAMAKINAEDEAELLIEWAKERLSLPNLTTEHYQKQHTVTFSTFLTHPDERCLFAFVII